MKKIVLVLFLFSCNNPSDKKTALEYYVKIGTHLTKVNSEVQNTNNMILKLFNLVIESDTVDNNQLVETNNAVISLIVLIEDQKQYISNIPDINSEENIKESSLVLLDKLLVVEKNKVPKFIKLISSKNESDKDRAKNIANEIFSSLQKANKQAQSSEEKFWNEFGIDGNDLNAFYKENGIKVTAQKTIGGIDKK